MTKEELEYEKQLGFKDMEIKDKEVRIADLEDKLANADYQLEGRDNEIRELKEQIEKMKRCYTCKHHTDLGYCKLKQNNGVCENHDKWEIKENDL